MFRIAQQQLQRPLSRQPAVDSWARQQYESAERKVAAEVQPLATRSPSKPVDADDDWQTF
ncbi:hypothetical protein D3C81_2225200 [compost metagenome]